MYISSWGPPQPSSASSLQCKNAALHSCLNEINMAGMSTCNVSLHLQKQRSISLHNSSALWMALVFFFPHTGLVMKP